MTTDDMSEKPARTYEITNHDGTTRLVHGDFATISAEGTTMTIIRIIPPGRTHHPAMAINLKTVRHVEDVTDTIHLRPSR